MSDHVALVMLSSRAVARAVARSINQELHLEVVTATDALMAEDWLQSGQVGVAVVNKSFADGEGLELSLGHEVATLVVAGSWTPEFDADMKAMGVYACIKADQRLNSRVVDLVDKICGVLA